MKLITLSAWIATLCATSFTFAASTEHSTKSDLMVRSCEYNARAEAREQGRMLAKIEKQPVVTTDINGETHVYLYVGVQENGSVSKGTVVCSFDDDTNFFLGIRFRAGTPAQLSAKDNTR